MGVYVGGMTDLPVPDPSLMQTPAPPFSPPPPSTAVVGAGPLGQRRSIATVLLLTIVTLGIWQLVWSYQNGDELKRYSNKGFGGVVYLVFSFVFYPVTMFLMASEVEQLYRNEGEEPPITAIWGLWFLLPIIGNLIWYVRIQRSINDYWASQGAAV